MTKLLSFRIKSRGNGLLEGLWIELYCNVTRCGMYGNISACVESPSMANFKSKNWKFKKRDLDRGRL